MDLLANVIFNATLSGNKSISKGNDYVRYFPEEISPFAGLKETTIENFEALSSLVSINRELAVITPPDYKIPQPWSTLYQSVFLQMTYEHAPSSFTPDYPIKRLDLSHVQDMLQLVEITKPGFFFSGTLAFGNYFGIFDGSKLVSMAGQRFRAGNYCEVSAVCTDPNYLGRGMAGTLIKFQLKLIQESGNIPFLHVSEEKTQTKIYYERLGLQLHGKVNIQVIKNRLQ